MRAVVVLWPDLYAWWLGWRSWLLLRYWMIWLKITLSIIFEKIGRIATGRKFFGFRRSSFLCSGITFAFFHNSENFLEEIDKLMMWVSAGKISDLISLITLVSMRSKPNELELLRSEMILSTLSGCTAESWKEQVLPVIKVLSLARGSDTGGGRFSLILLTLFRNLTNKLPVIEFYKWDSQSFGNRGIVLNGYVNIYIEETFTVFYKLI